MTLRAIAFDYGLVLSNPQDPHANQHLKRLTGLSHEEFERHYWVDRHAYDRGDLSGIEFWQRLADAAGLDRSPEAIHELNLWDARQWTTSNPEMLAWHTSLKQHGLKTAILSNMGDSVLESIEANFTWINDFDVLIWSYQHRIAKPEPEIYHLLLERLGTAPEETLFLDDKLENIEAAHKLGIQAIQFSTVDQLRRDLFAENLHTQLPMP